MAIDEDLTWFQAATWPNKSRPLPVVAGFEDEDFGSTSATSCELESSGKHSSVVDDKEIAGTTDLGEIVDIAMLVGDRTRRCSSIDQQARRVTRFARNLGNASLGKVVVEIGRAHGSKKAWLLGGNRQAEVLPCGCHRNATARRSRDQPTLNQKGFVDVLDSLGLLSDRNGQRRQSDRSPRELLTDSGQDLSIDFVETDCVDSKDGQSTISNLPIDRGVSFDFGEVADPP